MFRDVIMLAARILDVAISRYEHVCYMVTAACPSYNAYKRDVFRRDINAGVNRPFCVYHADAAS